MRACESGPNALTGVELTASFSPEEKLGSSRVYGRAANLSEGPQQAWGMRRFWLRAGGDAFRRLEVRAVEPVAFDQAPRAGSAFD